jgi:hypothetical protein
LHQGNQQDRLLSRRRHVIRLVSGRKKKQSPPGRGVPGDALGVDGAIIADALRLVKRNCAM